MTKRNLNKKKTVSVTYKPFARMLRNRIYLPGKTGRGGQMKTFGYCYIHLIDSKNIFGMSAPPGEKYEHSLLPDVRFFVNFCSVFC